jgi:hypothetical protein
MVNIEDLNYALLLPLINAFFCRLSAFKKDSMHYSSSVPVRCVIRRTMEKQDNPAAFIYSNINLFFFFGDFFNN